MKYLYVDNFRGFSKTVMPFQNVNFLVGENSTGKTSILGLINLLSTYDFWMEQNFNVPGHEFGGFRDILSATSSHNAEFSFGIYEKGQKKLERSHCFLAFYQEQEALPVLSFFGSLYGNNLLMLNRFGDAWKYSGKKIAKNIIIDSPQKAFEIIAEERDVETNKYHPFPEEFSSRFRILNMIHAATYYIPSKMHDRMNFPPVQLFTQKLSLLAPIRTKPKRTYDGYGTPFSPEGEHTPYLLRKKLYNAGKAEPFRVALESFGNSSGLFSSVKINKLGKDAAAPFELLIHILPSCALRINSVGYGISQVLPLVTDMLVRPNGSWFAIQQPEVHLHPHAQAALGDLIYQMAESEKKGFLIETHSDFTIDRFRMNFKKYKDHKVKAQVLFFERSKHGNKVSVLPIQDNGEYPDEQPSSFRDFFLNEQMHLLGL